MKIGIYIPGLGQSFQEEHVEKYATRLLNEIRYKTKGGDFSLKSEKIEYSLEKTCTVVTLTDELNAGQVLYKLYEFKYYELLTSKFKSRNILLKNASLLFLVLKKLPIIIARLFKSGSYNNPFQTFYIFLMFLIIALSILFTLPAVAEIITNTFKMPQIKDTFDVNIDEIRIHKFMQIFVSAIAIILILAPRSRTMATELSGEFLCINNYIEFGAQNQEILGNLDLLVEYISENEPDPKIHYHTYSCGSVIAIDFLFQYGNIPSSNCQLYSEALITIAVPYEFIKTYYPHYYEKRNKMMAEKITWINVYSVADALGTSFRKDDKIGEAEYSLPGFEITPVNLNYEVAPVNKYSISNFFSLYSLRAHGMYWDPAVEGQSCVRLIYTELRGRKLVDC